MDHQKHYDRLVERARARDIPDEYLERHHVIPRCLGGSDIPENIAVLTAGEHYLAHQLLTKIYPDEPKLIYALRRMTHSSSSNIRNNKMYGWIRKRFSESVSGRNNPMFGKVRTEEWRKTHSERMSGERNPHFGKRGKDAPAFGHTPSAEAIKKKIESVSRNWIFISPEGEEIRVKNANRFCKERGLHSGAMYSVASGKLTHYKKWKCKKLS